LPNLPGETQRDSSQLLDEAVKIVETGRQRDILLRIFGATAILSHCPNYARLFGLMGRKLGDIDLASYDKNTSGIAELFAGLGYEEDLTVSAFGGGRMIFRRKTDGIHCDVFLGKLEMSHVLSFEGRLEIDYPTAPLADLFLSKMQIFKLNEKDVIDTVVLLREHQLGSGDKEMINSEYISKLCSRDWGLWRTVTGNLQKMSELLPTYTLLPDADKADVSAKVKALGEAIESVSKTLSWKMRARVGESRKWYNEVEDLYR
jgi:hypothetical protein